MYVGETWGLGLGDLPWACFQSKMSVSSLWSNTYLARWFFKKTSIQTPSIQEASGTDRRSSHIDKAKHVHSGSLQEALCQAHQGPHPVFVTGLTWVSGGAPADGEDLAQVLILLWEALLQPLQLAQALAALMLHGAHVLDEVELGLGGVVAQDTVVVAALSLHATLMLL